MEFRCGQAREGETCVGLICMKLAVPFKGREALISSFSHTLSRKDQRQSVPGGGSHHRGTNTDTGTAFCLVVLSQRLVELFLWGMTQ